MSDDKFFYKGKLVYACEIAEREDLEIKPLWSRLKAGYSVEKAVSIGKLREAKEESPPITKHQLDLDIKNKQKRDEKLLTENACFAQCTRRINSK